MYSPINKENSPLKQQESQKAVFSKIMSLYMEIPWLHGNTIIQGCGETHKNELI
jgi:hypothetical protein